VAVDGDGNIYVADYSGGRVQVFDAAGDFQAQWTIESENDVYLTGMAVGRDGTVFGIYGGDLHRFDGQTGEDLGTLEYEDGWGFGDVTVLADGGLAATWYKNRDDVIYFNNDYEVETVLQEAISSITDDSEVTLKVAADGLGNVFVLTGNSEAVFKFDAEGDFVNRFGSSGDDQGQFRAVGDIAIDNQGRVYVSDIKGVQVFDPDGRYLALIDPPEFAYAYGLTVDDDNYLYMVGNNKVYKYQLEADE
jgi:sugar lactone lactonase YvrE